MCGITGFIGSGNDALLKEMTNSIAHRGPDADGLYSDPNTRVFLGHRRLSILDLAGGQQPMWLSDRKLGIVYNGEIYNHLDLRDELEKRGHTFATDHSDTETALRAYAEWGSACVEKFNGMW